ncbi:MAG: DNA primase, partial [Planctomycetes bacterium]|nr:DNA primase [Planctomycetota bacterium]
MDRFEEAVMAVKERADLLRVVEESVQLRSRGSYHVGLCPFHREKTPSFTVRSDRQFFKCYGCGKAGDVFAFLMLRDGLTFRAVLELLAERHGVGLEGVFARRGGSAGGPRQDVGAVLARVRDWFAQMLQTAQGDAARAYLAERGLDGATDSFGLGFHPEGRALGAFVARQKLPREVLEQAGLLGADGYERFAGRLMFPIHDDRGRVVGFGGRVLVPTERAKYLNSPES